MTRNTWPAPAGESSLYRRQVSTWGRSASTYRSDPRSRNGAGQRDGSHLEVSDTATVRASVCRIRLLPLGQRSPAKGPDGIGCPTQADPVVTVICKVSNGDPITRTFGTDPVWEHVTRGDQAGFATDEWTDTEISVSSIQGCG